MRDAWVDMWLQDNPGWELADPGEPGTHWLAEDGWMDEEPALRDPPFHNKPKVVGWALVRKQ